MEIPILAAKEIAERYDYDQVIVIGRKIGSHEHCTTYGRDKANCDVAARIGDFLKYRVMGWVKETPGDVDRDSSTSGTSDGDA